MRTLVCKYRNIKERIDKGVDKINIKTLFFIIIALLVFMAYYTVSRKPVNVIIHKHSHTNYYQQQVMHDTVIIESNMCKVVNYKPIKLKKVNYTSAELKAMGHKTTTTQKNIYKTCKLNKYE